MDRERTESAESSEGPENMEGSGHVRLPGGAGIEEGRARKFVVPHPREEIEVEIVVCRLDGRLFALDSLCPHEGGRLAEGPLWEGRYVFCPLHLYRFDPHDGRSVEIECEPATTYRLELAGEDVLVWI